MHEYRGSSYAAGGDEEAITIPNVSFEEGRPGDLVVAKRTRSRVEEEESKRGGRARADFVSSSRR